MAELQRTRGQYEISTDPQRIDVAATHAFLSRSYWAEGISRELVARSIANSLCFALLHAERQVGFARVVTDRATFAYLCDVYVLEEHRGRGLGNWLVEEARAHPDLQGLRRFLLVTKDAHSLYAGLGFQPPANPAGFMEIAVPGLYEAGRLRMCCSRFVWLLAIVSALASTRCSTTTHTSRGTPAANTWLEEHESGDATVTLAEWLGGGGDPNRAVAGGAVARTPGTAGNAGPNHLHL